ncbi:MAG: gamma carbonic anhydrase family protein [Gammaproteobacteria bacterium]
MLYTLDGISPDIRDDSVFVAPNATVIGDVCLHPGSSIWFNAVLRGDIETITIGRDSNIQDGSILHTDPNNPLDVGERVTVGHLVMLHGCRIGDNSLVGIGSTILNGASIGSNSIVGANALVTENKEFPEGVLILGAPARISRDLSPEEIGGLDEQAKRYAKRAQKYLASLRTIDD